MVTAALAALALFAAAPAPEGTAPADPVPERLRVRTVAGRIAELAVTAGRLAIEGPDGRITLALDRNTVVYLEFHQGTVRDLALGQPIRAGVGAQGQAYWVEVVPPASALPAKPPAARPGAPPQS